MLMSQDKMLMLVAAAGVAFADSSRAATYFDRVCWSGSNRTCGEHVDWQHPRYRAHFPWLAGAKAPEVSWVGEQIIPRRISQTGPPKKSGWHRSFRASYGSWQIHHPTWTYHFWNDSLTNESNPDLEPFVEEHFPFFLQAWKRLCFPIMRYDVARYMWLFLHGGVYSDLDIQALESLEATPVLRGASLVLPGDDLLHDRETCPPVRGISPPSHGETNVLCAPHIGNYWMASVPGHPLWLLMLSYVSDNVDALCARRHAKKNVLELTGPLGLGRVVAIYKEVAHVFRSEHRYQGIRFIDRKAFFHEFKYYPAPQKHCTQRKLAFKPKIVRSSTAFTRSAERCAVEAKRPLCQCFCNCTSIGTDRAGNGAHAFGRMYPTDSWRPKKASMAVTTAAAAAPRVTVSSVVAAAAARGRQWMRERGTYVWPAHSTRCGGRDGEGCTGSAHA